jgi:2-polyprenyl-6-methoxyphenol hydroxylase-like FAD-dependent oxidoreductase
MLFISSVALTVLDQGQGGGIAMEDAATLAVVLPAGTLPEDIPERLKLYEKIRYKRANAIQEFSRQAGKDFIDGKPQIDSKWRIIPIFLCMHLLKDQ